MTCVYYRFYAFMNIHKFLDLFCLCNFLPIGRRCPKKGRLDVFEERVGWLSERVLVCLGCCYPTMERSIGRCSNGLVYTAHVAEGLKLKTIK